MATVSEQITSLQNNSTITKAANNANAANTTKSGDSSSVSSDQFLQLLTMQLQYQDPMNPMDNSEMLAQEAQFVTLEQLEKLTSTFSEFSTIYQANSLIGQNVEISSEDGTTTTKGTVDYVDYSDKNGASVSVNGTLYPLNNVSKVYPKDTSVSEEEATQKEEDKNFIKEMLSYSAYNLGNIAEKLNSYIGGGSSNSEGATNNTTNENNQ